MRRVSPELNPPTFRCSHKYNLCSGPSTSFPSATGIVFPAPHSVLLTCPGMSSRPSCVCLKNSSFHDSGTILLSARSNVSANASSALPMTSDADVCSQNACSAPMEAPRIASRTASSTSSVMSRRPRFPTLTEIVVCVVAPDSSHTHTMSHECPRPYPPTFRCSLRYTPCYVPIESRPFTTGARTVLPTKLVLTCATISSGPSSV